MADATDSATPSPRGRGKSRGGLGKYLRARGRGRGRGRPAEFGTRLVLEEEQTAELDEEEQKEQERKYSRRQLGTNADRYAESEPELDSDGEPIVEPEVDLTSFLERQRQVVSEGPSVATSSADNQDDIDHRLAQLLKSAKVADESRKGRTEQIVWDNTLEEMSREKAAAEATRDLKIRFKAKTERERLRGGAKVVLRGRPKTDKAYIEAPALPTDEPAPQKSEKENMEGFLDDLLG